MTARVGAARSSPVPPLIAVPGRAVPAGGVADWPDLDALAVPAACIRPLHRAGAVAAALLPVPLSDADADADQRMRAFSGLLLIGGPDVAPELYGRARHPRCYGVDPIRDAFEVACVRAAIRRRLPVLALCRGLQVLNVALGGTLEQDLRGNAERIDHGDPISRQRSLHAVELKPDSRVARAMGSSRPSCSSYHHQGIDRLAPDLVATGWAADGLVEAAELESGWAVGVQWHPEDTAATDGDQQRLFEAFVHMTAAVAGGVAR